MSDFVSLQTSLSGISNELVSATAGVAVSFWFDMQPDADAASQVPRWARALAQAHVNREVKILAHPDSAYALSGLMCDVIKVDLWPSELWVKVLQGAIENSYQQDIKQIVVMLPCRTSPVVWAQWALLNLPAIGAYLDHTTGLLQGKRGWEQILHRPDASRWLVIDRVVTYGAASVATDYLIQMRAFNPNARWIHDAQVNEEALLQCLNSYHKSALVSISSAKRDDLAAWDANKVVYLSTSGTLDSAKVSSLLSRWRQKYSHQWARVSAVIRMQNAPAPFVVSSLCHLWMMGFADQDGWSDQSESEFWILGDHLDEEALRSELLQCEI